MYWACTFIVMDSEEIELHAQTWLASNGYHQYTLKAIVHTKRTNVWEANVEVADVELCLFLNDDNGTVVDFTKSRHSHQSITDSIAITDAVSDTMSMYFELSTKLDVGTNRNFVGRIELIPDKQKPQLTKAFKIALPIVNNEESDKACRLANRFVNYLSMMTGTVVDHKRPLTMPTSHKVNLPSMLISVAQKHGMPDGAEFDRLEQADHFIHYFKNGYRALLDNNFADA